MELRKFLVPEFILGRGAIELVGRYARNFGSQKAMLVTDPGITQAGWTQKVEKVLKQEGIAYSIFDGITPNPKDYEVEEGVKHFDSEQCDIIIALGGGSPMDCAKGIGIVTSNRKDIHHFEGVDEVEHPMPPLICLPTTAGTAADISQFAIINNIRQKRKMAIISKAVVPDVALIDVDTTFTMDPELTAATGMDALVHAIEAYVSNASSTVTDLNALEAIKQITRNFPTVIKEPNNIKAREGMVLGSLLAGQAFSNASLGLVHAMSHSLGGLKDSAHGECNAALLEVVVAYNFDACPDKYRVIANKMSINTSGMSDDAVKGALLEEINSIRVSAGIELSMKSLGVDQSELPLLAKNAFNDACMATNPKAISIDQIAELYEKL